MDKEDQNSNETIARERRDLILAIIKPDGQPDLFNKAIEFAVSNPDINYGSITLEQGELISQNFPVGLRGIALCESARVCERNEQAYLNGTQIWLGHYVATKQIHRIASEENLLGTYLTDYISRLTNGTISGGSDSELWNAALKFRCPLGDLEKLYELVQTEEPDGFRIRAAQIAADLFMMKGNYTAGDNQAWQKAQLLLNFYCPILNLLDYKSQFQECNSIALEYLNQGTAELNVAKEYHDKATQFLVEHTVELDVFGKELCKEFSVIPSTTNYFGRVKTPGSTVEGMRKTKKNGMPADMIGLTIVLDGISDPNKLYDQAKFIAMKYISPDTHLIEFGTTESDGASIEMNWSECANLGGVSYLGNNDSKFKCNRTPPRKKLGYKGLHIDFHTPKPDSIGIELQIYGIKEYEEYLFGTPSHIIFKAIDSGILGRLSEFHKIPAIGSLIDANKPKVIEIANGILNNFRDLRHMLQYPNDLYLRANSVIRLQKVGEQLIGVDLGALVGQESAVDP